MGVSNSVAHCRRGQANAERAGLNGGVRIEYKDYNAVEGRFDRVVSVGLMEHLPHREYKSYMRKIASSMADRGIGLIHTIGCNWFKNEHDPFTQKYIFPGSRQARLSEITGLLERNRLAVLDVENIRQHYGYTVLGWLDKFRRNQPSLDPLRYDPRFCRMWEYYFACGIAAAFASNSAVFQVLFTKDYTAAVPLHRV